jgi:SWI/SNF-related matrix-associated actin-dependent regulator 1 of chromatin subfamily A
MKLSRNAFPGACNGCNDKVKALEGYRQKISGRWAVWCEDCKPGDSAAKVSRVRKITSEGVILWPYNADELNLIRSFPEARFVGRSSALWVSPAPGFDTGYWTCSTLEGHRSRVLELAAKLKLEVDLPALELSPEAKAAKDSGAYDFQIDGVDFLSKQFKAVLGDDMGLGKTVQALLALPQEARGLAIVPACVKHNWKQECERWRSDLKPIVLEGRKSFRLPEEGELIIINYEILPKWLEGNKTGGRKYDTYEHYTNKQKAELASVNLIVDEVHKVKNYKTNRARRVKGLSKHCLYGWYLSGTPMINRPLDLWGVLSAINLERDVFKGFKHFIECFNGQPNGYGGYEFGEPVALVPELLRRIMLRRKREKVLPDLPTKTYTSLTVDASATMNKKMDQLMLEFGSFLEDQVDQITIIDQIEDCLEDIELIEQDKNVKLPPFERFSKIRSDLATNRIPAALEYVEECEEQEVPLIVFSAHVKPVETIAQRDGWGCITGKTPSAERQRLVNEFQAGKLKGLACTVIAAGVGLTLTRAWKALFIDLDWTPANNWQAEDRICRIGQESSTCEIVRMVSSHVLEQHVHSLLAWKVRVIQAAIDNSIEVNPNVEEFAKELATVTTSKESNWLTDTDPDLPF